jgi:hypothetical protein
MASTGGHPVGRRHGPTRTAIFASSALVPTGQASHTLTRQQPSFGLLSPHSSEGLQWTALAYAQRDDTT